jgi:hypothetical protein
MVRRKRGEEESQITAMPRANGDELGSIAPPPESGLSVDPEDIGAQFLSNATEQYVSSWPRADTSSDGTGEEEWDADTVGALSSSFDLDPTGWERAVTRSLRIGTLSSEFPRAPSSVRKRPKPALEDERVDDWGDDVDLTDEVVHEASLLDHEGDELGEVESPSVRTDDTHTHGRRRGGHSAVRRKRAS